MDVRFFYHTPFGRMLLKGLMRPGFMDTAAAFLRSPLSKIMIRPYIRRNQIDMGDFPDQKYKSFAEFFARRKASTVCSGGDRKLISPCDGMLSYCKMEDGVRFQVKGSPYEIEDLIPQPNVAENFRDGFCLIYRLEASDYHHFCYVDDCYHSEGHFIPGSLHSVQPAACDREPVYRLNRRVWSLMDTKNLGLVAQIEVGALLVGDILHEQENRWTLRGEEMGHFELAGSTILQLFTEEIKQVVAFDPAVEEAFRRGEEIRIRQGQAIGEIRQ